MKLVTSVILIMLFTTMFSAIIILGVMLMAMLLYGAGPGWQFTLHRAPWIAGCVLIAIAFAHGRYVWGKRRRAGQSAGGESRSGAKQEG